MPFTLQDYITAANTRIVDSSNGTLSTANIVNFLNEGLRRIRRRTEIPTSLYVTEMFLMNGIYTYALPAGYTDYASINGTGVLPDNLDFLRIERETDFYRAFLHVNSYSESRNGSNRGALINLVNPALATPTVNLATEASGAGQGTWVADVASDATNVRTDTLIFKVGSGSVEFDIDVSQSVNDYAQLTNTTMTAVDLSGTNVANIGTMTVFVYLPTANFTSFTMNWGSDTSNYYTQTVTTQINGGAFVAGWNTLGFDWSTVTPAQTTGSPDNSAIDYLLFRATYPNTMTDQVGVRINGIYMREKRLVDFHYYSDYLIIDGVTGQPKEYFTDENDTSSYFNCDAEFVDWLTYDLMINVFTMYDIDASKAKYHEIRRDELEQDLAQKFASQREIPTTAYMENDEIQNFQN